MLIYYEEVNGYSLADGPEGGEDYYVVENMLRTAHRHGVPYKSTGYDSWLSLPAGTARRHLKIKSWFQVETGNTEEITRLLANGFPLIASINDGKLFRYLGAEEIYHGPISCNTAHAVVLHGSGMSVGKGDGTHGTYCACRNSHGDRAHPSYKNKRCGGDFNVWASDLIGPYVYGLNLADDATTMICCSMKSELKHLDLEFRSREEAEFVIDVSRYGNDRMFKPVWAPYNLSIFGKNAGSTKVEYQETKQDEMRTGNEEEEFMDWDEDKDEDEDDYDF